VFEAVVCPSLNGAELAIPDVQFITVAAAHPAPITPFATARLGKTVALAVYPAGHLATMCLQPSDVGGIDANAFPYNWEPAVVPLTVIAILPRKVVIVTRKPIVPRLLLIKRAEPETGMLGRRSQKLSVNPVVVLNRLSGSAPLETTESFSPSNWSAFPNP
jgi:hypothetical protein